MSRTTWIAIVVIVLLIAAYWWAQKNQKLPQWRAMVNRNMGYPGA